MAYLAQMNIIHRDLACRNLLVKQDDDEYIVKVADILTKNLISEIRVSLTDYILA